MQGRTKQGSDWCAIDNAIVLLFMSILWFSSALTGDPEHPDLSILIFICGFSLIKPLIRVFKACFRSKKDVHNSTQLLLSCLTLGMATGLVPVFFSFINDPAIFFIAYSAIQGILMLAVWKPVGQISIALTGLFLVINACFHFWASSTGFNNASFGAGFICLFFSGYSRIQPLISKAFATKRNKALSAGN